MKWEMKDLRGTEQWLKWLKWVRVREAQAVIIVQPCLREGCESSVVGESSAMTPIQDQNHGNYDVIQENIMQQVDEQITRDQHEPEGQADEGEQFEAVVGLLELADHEAMLDEQELAESLDNEDDGNEEDDDAEEDDYVPIPGEWNRRDKASIVVEDTHDSPFEYGSYLVQPGQIFSSKGALQDAVKMWALALRREFGVTCSSQDKYTVKCKTAGCQFRIHASKGKYQSFWKVAKVNEHSCRLENVVTKHRNLTSGLIANIMFNEIIEKRDMACTYIVQAMQRQFKYRISYAKAWRAKQKAMERRFGSFEASYTNMPRVLDALKDRNPDTYTAFKDTPSQQQAGVTIFHRAFIALGPCIDKFRYCRPLLCVDGTFLTGKYKGQILTAIGVDTDNQILPVAFAFVESENRESWLWFFRHLKQGVIHDRPNVCVIHDRHKGILSAIKSLVEDPNEPFPWRDLQSR
ncbi:hypothetical protein ACP4OV_019457 [Aristida adscensionis]